jgi:hypothetical protein
MIFSVAIPNLFQIVLAVPLGIWAIVSIIMTLEDENKGKRALSGYDWLRNYSPIWHRRLTIFVVLPTFVLFLVCRYYGL